MNKTLFSLVLLTTLSFQPSVYAGQLGARNGGYDNERLPDSWAPEISLSPEAIEKENRSLEKAGLDLHGQLFLSSKPYSLAGKVARPFLMPAFAYQLEPQESTRASALLADLPFLKYVLRMQYAGWEAAEQKGFDWNRFFAAWTAKLAQLGDRDIKFEEAFQPLAELKQVLPDNHTYPSFKGAQALSSRSVTATLVSNPRGSVTQMITESGAFLTVDPKDPATQPHPVLLGSSTGDYAAMEKRFLLTYQSSRGRIVAVVAGGERISLLEDDDQGGKARLASALQLAGQAKDIPMYRKLAPGIGYTRMPRMSMENQEAYGELFRNIDHLSDGREKVVIVDLRGNTGGYGHVGALPRWFSEEEFSAAVSNQSFRTTRKKSYFEGSLAWATAMRSKSLDTVSSASKDRLQQIIEMMREPKAPVHVPEISTFSEGPASGQETRPFNPALDPSRPILLALIDNFTSSAGEGTVHLLAKLPNVLLAGVNTSGTLEFSGVGTVLLPHSTIPFYLAVERTEVYRDGRSYEGYGSAPDIALPSARTNSPEYILELAQSLARLREGEAAGGR